MAALGSVIVATPTFPVVNVTQGALYAGIAIGAVTEFRVAVGIPRRFLKVGGVALSIESSSPTPSPLVVSDFFNRANGAMGVTDFGARTWVASGGSGWVIASNRAAWTGSTDGAIAVDSGLSDDYEIVFTAEALTGQYPLGIVVRGTSATNYLKMYRDQTANRWNLAAQDGSGAVFAAIGPDVVAGDVLGVHVHGNAFDLYQNNVFVYQFVDSRYAGGTFQGLVGSGTLGLQIDNFAIRRA